MHLLFTLGCEPTAVPVDLERRARKLRRGAPLDLRDRCCPRDWCVAMPGGAVVTTWNGRALEESPKPRARTLGDARRGGGTFDRFRRAARQSEAAGITVEA